MIKRLFDQIAGVLAAPEPVQDNADQRSGAIRKATAVLMLDVALADKTFDQSELEHLLAIAGARGSTTAWEALSSLPV